MNNLKINDTATRRRGDTERGKILPVTASPFLRVIFLLTFSLHASGCALFLIGAGAAGGYSITDDEVEGLADTTFVKVWTATREVLRTEGVLTLENKETGQINAKIGGSEVEVHIDQATPKTVRTRIKARKTNGLFPDIDLAQSLYSKMLRKLK